MLFLLYTWPKTFSLMFNVICESHFEVNHSGLVLSLLASKTPTKIPLNPTELDETELWFFSSSSESEVESHSTNEIMFKEIII